MSASVSQARIRISRNIHDSYLIKIFNKNEQIVYILIYKKTRLIKTIWK